MKVILFDINKQMIDAWEPEFAPYFSHPDHPVEIQLSSVGTLLATVDIDGLVSPANSFGFMDGGIDGVYSQLIPGIQQKVQTVINSKDYYGEIPVGQAFTVETRQPNPFELIVAPTMRVPHDLNNDLAINCYLATRAVFIEADRYYGSEQILAIPGMGTGCGYLPVDFVAKSMRKAYEDILLNKFSIPTQLGQASSQHRDIMNWLVGIG